MKKLIDTLISAVTLVFLTLMTAVLGSMVYFVLVAVGLL